MRVERIGHDIIAGMTVIYQRGPVTFAYGPGAFMREPNKDEDESDDDFEVRAIEEATQAGLPSLTIVRQQT